MKNEISMRFKLPETVDQERQVLADVLTEPECMGPISGLLTPEMFTGDKRPHIYKTMLAMYNRGEYITFVDLHARCGDAFIDEVITPGLNGGTTRVAVQHSLLIRRAAACRRMLSACVDMAQAASRPETSEQDIYTMAEILGREIEGTSGLASEVPIVTVAKQIKEGMKERREMAANGQLYRVPTGFKKLDELLYRGWGPGQLGIIAARPSTGKTALMLNMAKAAALAGIPTIVFSIEMTNEELGNRLIFSSGLVHPMELASGTVRDDIYDEATYWMQKVPLYINDHSRTLEEIVARITMNVRAGRCRMVYIDYLGLMDLQGDPRMTVAQSISKITAELKATAKLLKIPIVVLCQLNRESAKGDRAPELYDLRDSGAIEQDADVVMMLENEKAIEPTTGLRDINIWVRKNRQYKRDVCITVRPNSTYSEFTEVEPETLKA